MSPFRTHHPVDAWRNDRVLIADLLILLAGLISKWRAMGSLNTRHRKMHCLTWVGATGVVLKRARGERKFAQK